MRPARRRTASFLRDDYVSAIEKAGPLTVVKKQVGETIMTKRKSAIAKLLVTDRGGGCVRALQLIEETLIILTDTCKGHGGDLLIEDWAKPFKQHLKKVSAFLPARNTQCAACGVRRAVRAPHVVKHTQAEHGRTQGGWQRGSPVPGACHHPIHHQP
jgi:hypothetical protein